MQTAPRYMGILTAAVLIGIGGCDDQYEPSDEDVTSVDTFDISDVTDGCTEHSECSWGFRCVDSKCQESPTCELKEIPQGCSADLDEQECQAHDGVWSCDPCPGVDDCRCACPAGDSGCPCWSESHCEGDCIFPGEEDSNLEACSGIGYCSEYAVRWASGCMCMPDEGYPEIVCAC